jgi:hypothetical protein
MQQSITSITPLYLSTTTMSAAAPPQDLSFKGKLCVIEDKLVIQLTEPVLNLLSKERGIYGLRNGDHERYR